MHFPKKIPTLLGLFLAVLLVGGFIVGFEQASRMPSIASADIEPKNVEVTNVSDTSFTVSWITNAPTTGAVIVAGLSQKPEVVFDQRDLSSDQSTNGSHLGQYSTHSTIFRSGGPNTSYTIQVLSNGKTFAPLGLSTVKTGQTLIGSASTRGPAYGSVVLSNGQGADGALVYLTISGSQKLSTLVTSGGTWLIPVNLVRSADLAQFLPFPKERITEEIVVRTQEGVASAITDTLNDSPVPQMRIGKTYDFRKQQALAPSGQALANRVSTNPNVLGDTTVMTGSVTLIKPAQDSVLSTFMPLVEGMGLPGNTVTVVMGMTQPFGGTTTVDSDGIWRYTPSQPLNPGKQSVTITSTDSKGQPVAITHTFEIFKSGSQVLGLATPSATLAPTPIATSSPTPASTLSGQPIPQTGNTLPTIILIILGVWLFASGMVITFHP